MFSNCRVQVKKRFSNNLDSISADKLCTLTKPRDLVQIWMYRVQDAFRLKPWSNVLSRWHFSKQISQIFHNHWLITVTRVPGSYQIEPKELNFRLKGIFYWLKTYQQLMTALDCRMSQNTPEPTPWKLTASHSLKIVNIKCCVYQDRTCHEQNFFKCTSRGFSTKLMVRLLHFQRICTDHREELLSFMKIYV